MLKGQKWIHRLDKKSFNLIDKKAICAKCGLTKIIKSHSKRKNGQLGWRCYISFLRGKKIWKSFKNLPDKIKQKGRCPICSKNTKLVIDHCHTKNVFRNFICGNCNKMLGFSRDNTTTFKNAIKYLSKSY